MDPVLKDGLFSRRLEFLLLPGDVVMTAENLLAELGARMGMAGLQLDDNRACRLKFDGQLEVDFEAPEDGERLHLFGVVGPVPAQSPAAFYEHLLESNLPSGGTAGSTCALDQSSRDLLLCRSFDLRHTGVDELVRQLEELLCDLESWREWLATSSHESQAEDSDGEQLTPMMAV